ncbi:MAG: hypothetical protein ACK4S6_18415 [Roseateles asaccharophilus]|uniref:Protein TonB n=1 Tax=Roseateles asaccharophilus TaxID=582607 RepID=A0A4V3CK38_9BURK|nr:hypothetical protein [Roseateles asaccharophilus]MDN3543496.1 hypothetical protein [Roseateles asaccharophilus]TDP12126.1 hypothetical protein DFR39_102515 [Roseateles asaccharophilus]
MSFTELMRRLGAWAGLGLLLGWLAGCSGPRLPPGPPAGAQGSSAPAPKPGAAEGPRAAAPAPAPAQPKLGPPRPVRNAIELRQQAAERLVAANPERSYLGPVPEPLLAIPVLEVELHGDGRVKHIAVLRRPGQAQDTVQLAIDAVHRAAPFGDVSRMPRPWKFSETFLFNDQRRFKPRTLDQ